MLRVSQYQAPWWLRSRHLQTILPNFPLRGLPELDLVTEQVELPDGDFLVVHWSRSPGPVIVVVHGLEGSIKSPYAANVMGTLEQAGWCPVLLNFRGCGGVQNRLARSYHAGQTEDLRFFLEQVARRRPGQPIAALGYSLGGNMLLKYLGESGQHCPLRTAVAVSVPFDLRDACEAVSRGFSRLYGRFLLRQLKKTVRLKFAPESAPFSFSRAMRARTFAEFDDAVTAPLHGFANVDDYYRRSSCRQFLASIQVPTLIVHALDDPFMTPAAVPGSEELSEAVTLELSANGGHVGFLLGDAPWNLEPWLDARLVEHFADYLPARLPDSDGERQPLTAAG